MKKPTGGKTISKTEREEILEDMSKISKRQKELLNMLYRHRHDNRDTIRVVFREKAVDYIKEMIDTIELRIFRIKTILTLPTDEGEER